MGLSTIGEARGGRKGLSIFNPKKKKNEKSEDNVKANQPAMTHGFT